METEPQWQALLVGGPTANDWDSAPAFMTKTPSDVLPSWPALPYATQVIREIK